MKNIYSFVLILIVANTIPAQDNLYKRLPATNKQVQLTNYNNYEGNGSGIRFTPNKGQIADRNGNPRADVLYKTEGDGADIYLRKTGISYVYSNMAEIRNDIHEKIEEIEHSKEGFGVKTEEQWEQELIQDQNIKIHQVDMDFVGCQLIGLSPITLMKGETLVKAEDELDGYTNYYYTHCPQGVLNVKQYNKVTYKNIYNNIDISFFGGKQNGIKYDLIIQPHADPGQIKLHWKYAENIYLNRDGNLIVKTGVNEFIESIPKVYQTINGKIVDVKSHYILTPVSKGEAVISFSFSNFNSSYPLIIDPWVTYYGGLLEDRAFGVTTDPSGNLYVTGYSNSANGIASGGFQNSYVNADDAFLVKFNEAGVRLWATYYGGTSQEWALGVTTDAAGNVYMAGHTYSTSGIASGGFQNVYGGGGDAFLVKFDGAGALSWATYYGGTNDDCALGATTDPSGNVYVVGYTGSTTAIASGGFQNTFGGGTYNAFLVKFDGSGSRLWATYYGGTGVEYGRSVTTDASGNVYIAGPANSNTGITSGGFQNIYGGGIFDAFLVKYSGAGGPASRLWATYYGGTGREDGCGVATDTFGNVYLSGETNSSTSIASGGFQNIYAGTTDAFLVKFNGAGGAGSRLWATYLGGSFFEERAVVAVDKLTNDVYIGGDTYSLNFPVTSCAWQKTLAGGISEDIFLTHFTSAGQMVCSSYIGGTHTINDEDGRIALFGCYIYVTGNTNGSFPVTSGAYQTAYGGNGSTYGDAFIAQLYKNTCSIDNKLNVAFNNTASNVCTNTPVNFTPSYSGCDTAGIVYKWTFTGGTPSSSSLQLPTVTYPAPGTYPVKLVISANCGKDSLTKTAAVTIISCGGIVANVNSAATCSGATTCPTLTATGNSGTAPYTYLWSTIATTSSISPCPITTSNYTVTITDNAGLSATSVAIVSVNPAVNVTVIPVNNLCNGDTNGSATANAGNGTPGYTYNWSNGSTTSLISNLTSQIYTVTVIDSKGCSVISTTTIISPPSLGGQFTKGTANCAACGCKEWIMVKATGGSGPYSYSWPDGYTNRYKNQLCPGNYTINIKDKNGCSVNVNITAP